MTSEQAPLAGPELSDGIDISELPNNRPLLGQVRGQSVILVRSAGEFFAVGATCSHYGGPLADGFVDGETIRCPWHHACFKLRTGEARAPALSPIDCYTTEQRNNRIYVLSKKHNVAKIAGSLLSKVVIVGGGAAGHMAAETLRTEGYHGEIALLSAEADLPVDRPNLSKDFLAGTAPEEWVPLRTPEFFVDNRIDVVLNARVSRIDTAGQQVTTHGGRTFAYDALLLATGAEPVRLDIPGSERSNVHYLRSLAQCRSIIAQASNADAAVIIGASFIGLEVAAALRERGLQVHVVAPDRRPLERIMGPSIGDYIRTLHERHGVVFHLGNTVQLIGDDSATLADGKRVPCKLVVVGVGVKPCLELALQAGLTIDRGIVVNEHLETSVPGIYAAGDIARWPDPHSGRNIRVEHWVVAQRQGQLAAQNMLGQKLVCDIVPYFWSQHYDVTISYVGHAEKWDSIDQTGDPAQGDCTVALRAEEKTLALITIGRDIESLRAEAAFEHGDVAELASFGAR